MDNGTYLRKTEKKIFETLDDSVLIWYCVEPVLDIIRAKNISVKKDTNGVLNESQRALLMFQILYGHTKSGIRELFYGDYYLSTPGFWQQLKNAIQRLGDVSLPPIIGEIEQVYNDIKSGAEEREPENDEGMDLRIKDIDARLAKALPETVKLAAAYIRANPGDFTEII